MFVYLHSSFMAAQACYVGLPTLEMLLDSVTANERGPTWDTLQLNVEERDPYAVCANSTSAQIMDAKIFCCVRDHHVPTSRIEDALALLRSYWKKTT